MRKRMCMWDNWPMRRIIRRRSLLYLVLVVRLRILPAITARIMALWHWAATWNWWTIGTSGALSALARFGEHALGILLLFIATFGVVSKLSHSKQMADLSGAERRLWKVIGTVVVVLFFLYMTALISYNAMKEDSWSNLPKMVAYVRERPVTISRELLDRCWRSDVPVPPIDTLIPPVPKPGPRPILTSFVFLRFPLLVGTGQSTTLDSWDFIIVHRGGKEVDSIDMMFKDNDALDHIRATTPDGIAISADRYSRLLHIDRMYPHGLGSIFAQQFIWKPFSLDHGHFTIDFSTSAIRYRQDLYIERIQDGKLRGGQDWASASAVIDPDNKTTLLICRDRAIPQSIAQDIHTETQCWPDTWNK